MRSLVIRYHEVALKGKNRPFFVSRLVRNLRVATRGMAVGDIRSLPGRIVMGPIPTGTCQAVIEEVRRVFGVVNFSVAEEVSPSLEKLKEAMGREIPRLSFRTFRVTTRREDKSFPLTSPDVNREIGAHIQTLCPARVDLENPDLTVYIEILREAAFFSWTKIRGPGGLPAGVSGRVILLLSGGIDSPVASYLMMKRGCEVIFVHFHSYPLVSKSSQEKVQEIVHRLTRYQYRSRLYLVPFAEVQREIILRGPPAYRVVLYRRFMVRIAQEIARREGAQALATGESLGQVASQTLENMTAIDEAATVPIFRPLIGMDKEEIITVAREIGTYETSIIPDEDCCRLFMPRRPVVRGRIEEVKRAEAALDPDALVRMAVEKVAVEESVYPEG